MTEPSEISETVLEKSEPTHPPHHLYRLATLQERLCSFLVDLLINAYLIAGWGLLLSLALHKPILDRSSQLLFASTALALHFGYFLLFEGVFAATPGKMMGGLIIHRKGGGVPSLAAVFVRNLFRIFDYPLFFLTGLGLMEVSRKCCRSGDLLAGTVALKKMPYREYPAAVREARPASVTVRFLAFLIDLPLLLGFLYGFLLWIPAGRTLSSTLLLNLSPLFLLLFLSLCEFLWRTSFGKILFGYHVLQEDGTPPTLASALIRNLFRPLDLNPLSYLVALSSKKKQRPGDIIAGTRIMKLPRRWRGWISLPFLLILSATMVFFGSRNRQNFYETGHAVRVAQWTIDPIPIALQRLFFRSLHLERLDLAFSTTEVNERRRFDRGDVIFVLFRVSGYFVKNGRAWVQADLNVRDPAGNLILDRLNVVNASLTDPKKYADLAARFALHPQASSGRYQLELTIRDRLSRSTLRQTVTFLVP